MTSQIWTDRKTLVRTSKEAFTVPTEFAVLDAQWTPHGQRSGALLVVAASTGMVVFYELTVSDAGKASLIHRSEKIIADASTLVLSLAWHPSRADIVGFTLSDGNVGLCESVRGPPPWSRDAVVRLTDIHHHELEAWTLSFAGPDGTNVLSGGDDAMLQSSRINDDGQSTGLWRDRRIHDAGVTAILPLSDELLVTGSYDDHIRLVFAPAAGRRQILAQANLDGGVWRLKLLCSTNEQSLQQQRQEGSNTTKSSFVILASCMHAGARVVRLCKGSDSSNGGASSQWEFVVDARFEEHRSMNYGSDVVPRGGSGDGDAARMGGSMTIASTSFYDKLVCLWSVDLKRRVGISN